MKPIVEYFKEILNKKNSSVFALLLIHWFNIICFFIFLFINFNVSYFQQKTLMLAAIIKVMYAFYTKKTKKLRSYIYILN
jgi:hypothetical protein